jgi:multisubunit Na+/H+ antiporter MnhE subunit
MTRAILTITALAVVYSLALASADVWDLSFGVVLGASVYFMFRQFLFVTPPISVRTLLSRFAHAPILIAATGVNIVRGTVAVIRVSLRPLPPGNVGFITIPDGERTSSGVDVSGLLDTLSPGSVLIDQDATARTWTIHALDASDEEGIRRAAQQFYDDYQRPVWP